MELKGRQGELAYRVRGVQVIPGHGFEERRLLNMITTSLYLGLPLLWTAMMAWAGVKVGTGISNAVVPLAQPGKEAGQQDPPEPIDLPSRKTASTTPKQPSDNDRGSTCNGYFV